MGKIKIYSETCELNITRHCILSCRACSHFSPLAKKYNMPLSMIFNDLAILSKVFYVNHVRILGGEPLLHQDLKGVIKNVRRTGISDRIQVVTNGLLLWKMKDEFWENIDSVEISVYPGKEMAEEKLRLCQEKAILYNVDFKEFYVDRFRVSYSEIGTNDKELIQRIYNTCLIAHQWRCYSVQDGYFFKCPQSIFIPRFLRKDDFLNSFVDGIKIIDSSEFRESLTAYLESAKPLASCKYCLGSIGKLFPHGEVSRRKWRQLQNKSTEDQIDMEYLYILESVNPKADDLCLRSHLLLPDNKKRALRYGLIA